MIECQLEHEKKYDEYSFHVDMKALHGIWHVTLQGFMHILH